MNTASIFDPKKLETKWQKYWQEHQTYQPDVASAKKPYYNLMMFPYPSAEGLHVGNMYAFTGADIRGRFKRMQGYDVFEPIGLDGFGIHSENYAIKIGKHPKDQAKVSEKHFYDQLHQIGNGFAWGNKLETYDPAYYRWTQWLFVQMYKHGLAYRKMASVNWCPSCKTVLADEQVEGGVCERCKTPTARKQTPQWFFKITQYAEQLLNNLEKIDWPNKIKIAQKNWIGKSEGMEISWKIEEIGESIVTFTTRPDTICGATFIVLAPDHPLAVRLGISKEAKQYIKESLEKTEQHRKTEEKKKTGVATGYNVIHPLTKEKLPIWIADFVLMSYGTGAIMSVPAYDERDAEFAKKFNLPIKTIEPDSNIKFGTYAHKKTIYHLRDWLISRQRYWGPPIPMVHCETCDWQPVPESDLPVLLPDIKEYQPKGDGRSPLENAPEDWLYTTCPKCGGKAKRETDVSDTFLDSSWYFLAYPSINSESSDLKIENLKLKIPWNQQITRKWLPVDVYIGGAEHAVLHLLYSRFVWMVLHDWKFISKKLGDEPFPFLFSHGLIIKDGAKMSKSRGNVVNPDEYIARYGADALRMYLMFLGPYDQGGDFRDTGIAGMYRFLERIYQRFQDEHAITQKTDKELLVVLHKTIRRMTNGLEKFHYNTSISALMEFMNAWRDKSLSNNDASKFLQLIAPFAPHMSEELWEQLDCKSSIHASKWPVFDESLVVTDIIELPVQINGKTRAILSVAADQASDEQTIVGLAKQLPNVEHYLSGKQLVRHIFVAGKTVNFVIR